MILPVDISPDDSLYVLGAHLLKIMRQQDSRIHDLYELFLAAKRSCRGITFYQYHLALDWLYILGHIELADSGDIFDAKKGRKA